MEAPHTYGVEQPLLRHLFSVSPQSYYQVRTEIDTNDLAVTKKT